MTIAPIETVALAKAAEAEKKLLPSTFIEEPKKRSITERVMYEANVEGTVRSYPVAVSTPRAGRFFVMKTYEEDGRSRIIISPKDWNETFTFSEGMVITKYGLAKGSTCNVTLKLIDVLVDVDSERVIGVYIAMMSPNFSRLDVDVHKLLAESTQSDIGQIKEEVLVHEGLMLKFQLDEAIRRGETYRQALVGRNINVVKLGEDFAAPIVEITLGALDATKRMFEQYYGSTEPWYVRHKKALLIFGVGLGIILFAAILRAIF